jgi:hypothetical protein
MDMPLAPAPMFRNSLEYFANWAVAGLQKSKNSRVGRGQYFLVLRTTEVNTINLF